MARKAKPIACNESDIKELEMLASGSHVSTAVQKRAQAILLCAEGKENKDIAKRLEVRPHTVGEWRNEYLADGLQGLMNKSRPGRRGGARPDPKPEVLRLAGLAGEQASSGEKMTASQIGELVGISADAVRRILRDNGMTLTRVRNWSLNSDITTAQQHVDIVGLYISKDIKALILCISDAEVSCSNGKIITKNSKKAKLLEDNLDIDGNVSLIDALNILSNSKIEPSQCAKININTFLISCLNKVDNKAGIQYQVVIQNSDETNLIKLNSRNITFVETYDVKSWINYTESWIRLLCEEKIKIIDAIRKYLKIGTNDQIDDDPFAWSRSDILLQHQDEIKIDQNWNKNILSIHVSIKTSNGEELNVIKNVYDALHDFNEIDCDSALGLGTSTETVTDTFSDVFKDVNKSINEKFINAAVLKKRNLQCENFKTRD